MPRLNSLVRIGPLHRIRILLLLLALLIAVNALMA
jgi:hypothetical protein